MEMITIISELEQKIESFEAIVATQSEVIDTQSETIAKLEALVKFYEEQFALSQRRQFGSSSEQTPDQLRFENIFNEPEDQADPSLPEPTIEEITYKRKKQKGKRADDLSGLPKDRIDHELPESERSCPECGDLMNDMGVTIRNELEIIPAQVRHKEIAVHAYGCSNCEKNGDQATIVRAEAPVSLISGSLASSTAVAHIASQKYGQGMPLYRIERELNHSGVNLSRQTMSNWLIYCAQNYLVAIYLLLISYFLMEKIGHADETKVQVLHEPGRSPQTNSYEWIYRTDRYSKHKIVIFQYRETRGHEHPKEFLKGFKGYIHCDGYQAYQKLPSDIIPVGCWAHCRRYWEKLYESIKNVKARDGSIAERGLVYINLLFAFEHEFRDLSPEERYKKRLELSKPVSDDFFDWVETIHALPKSLLGEAVTYATLQREYLENVYLDGRLELSNNAAERSAKMFVIGRKAWLFSNTPNGAESSSMYYSIVETARENGLIPFQYIKYLLERLPSAKTSELESLLPWSESLPSICRAPVKGSNKKQAKPKYSNKKGSPLDLALEKLRERYRRQGADALVNQPLL
jgi:transposase